MKTRVFWRQGTPTVSEYDGYVPSIEHIEGEEFELVLRKDLGEGKCSQLESAEFSLTSIRKFEVIP